ncbi:hypothetical protein AeMF1_012417 [Aphanomyces euteiches]|nr:hypothetical protein AeMF1_012417 [Aphanomyces euteiches]KAH9196150.1 hypothetical protein AeNC1_001888 [Aphanomyces euteiches]
MKAFRSIFVGVAAMALQAAAVSMTLLRGCPVNSTQNTSVIEATRSVCLRGANGGVVRVEYNGTSVNLSNQGISKVEGIPKDLVSIDLSSNNIYSLTNELYDSNLQNINLSNNQLSFVSSIAFPPSVKNLDLSLNNLQTIEINWAGLTQLSFLNLSWCNIIYIDKPVFPTSLWILDLSNNQVRLADLSSATYQFLTTRRVMYSLDSLHTQALVSTCTDVGNPKTLDKGVVCVFDGSRESIQTGLMASLRRLTIISLVITVVIILGFLILHWYRRRNGLDGGSLRDRTEKTLTSSACESYVEPNQYRESLTPIAVPSRP